MKRVMADDRRQQLADVLRDARTDPSLSRGDVIQLTDALLPLLNQVAADAAAEALEKAASDYGPRRSYSSNIHADWLRRELRARAAELRAPARTDEEN